MEFTNFDQMNQMIAVASGMLNQTLLWLLSGLALGLSVCSLGGALAQCWQEARPPQRRKPARQAGRAHANALQPRLCA